MHATFPNQAQPPPTIAFAQATASFMTAERAVHRGGTPAQVEATKN
jgi:hypothetical protein